MITRINMFNSSDVNIASRFFFSQDICQNFYFTESLINIFEHASDEKLLIKNKDDAIKEGVWLDNLKKQRLETNVQIHNSYITTSHNGCSFKHNKTSNRSLYSGRGIILGIQLSTGELLKLNCGRLQEFYRQLPVN